MTGFLSIFITYFANLNRWFRWTLLFKKNIHRLSEWSSSIIFHILQSSGTESLPSLSILGREWLSFIVQNLWTFSPFLSKSDYLLSLGFKYILIKFQNSFQLRGRQLWNDENGIVGLENILFQSKKYQHFREDPWIIL